MTNLHSSLTLLLALALGNCTPDTVPLNGLPCDNGACGKRFVCHPETNRCVPPLTAACDQTGAICPSTVTDGDPCPSSGSFIPCTDDITDCSLGCRTCETTGWSECSTPGDCDTCTDYFRDDDGDSAGVTGDTQCLCEPTGDYTATVGDDCDDSVATGASCTDTCTTVYADTDGDTLGDAATSLTACTPPASGYVADDTDCDDNNANCGADCTDDDSDGYCLGIDCDDALPNCTADCTDVDSDGYCLGIDCDDALPNCTLDCTDGDTDGYCLGVDCDDALPNCTLDCTDGDTDGYCLGVDCNDDDDTCTDDCSTCAPGALTLTVTNALPIGTDDTVNLDIDMGTYARDVTSELSCTATPYTVFGPHDFTGQPNLNTLGLAGQRENLDAVATPPFDQATCSSAGDFVRLDDHNQGAHLRLDPHLDLTSYVGLGLSFVAAVPDASGIVLDVEACCGNGCSFASVQTVAPADISGTTNACSVQQITIPHDECSSLALRWSWPGDGEFLGIDDVSIDGTVTVGAITAGTPGIYTTSFTAGPPGTFDITCTWENGAIGPSVDDTETVTIE